MYYTVTRTIEINVGDVVTCRTNDGLEPCCVTAVHPDYIEAYMLIDPEKTVESYLVETEIQI